MPSTRSKKPVAAGAATSSSSSLMTVSPVAEANMQEILQVPTTFSDFVKPLPESAELMETHLSSICLLGDFAFKIKKAVNLGPPFADQSLLSERKRLCDEEYQKNKEWNDCLYLGVFPLYRNTNGEIRAVKNHRRRKQLGEIIDYCLWMRRFPTDMRLDKVIQRNELDISCVKDFGHRLAQLQAKARPIAAQGTTIVNAIMDNLRQLEETEQGRNDIPTLSRIRSWLTENIERLKPVLRSREERGMIRELHADLHARNLYLKDNEIHMFDCLEFSDELARIDVTTDIAFLFMDLLVRQRADLAWVFVDSWLEESGDYEALKILRLLTVYRALVRCKISALSLKNKTDKATNLQEYEKYLRLSEKLVSREHGAIIAMCGKSGSGKSFWSKKLVPRIEACRVRSDVERKRLFADEARKTGDEASGDRKRLHLYSEGITDDTYAALIEAARAASVGKVTLIVDASFLSHQRRVDLRNAVQASDPEAPCVFVVCNADEKTLQSRVLKRSLEGIDVSDATLDILSKQRMDEFLPIDTLIKFEHHTDGPDEKEDESLQELCSKLGQFYSR